jgi:hypothetical protein
MKKTDFFYNKEIIASLFIILFFSQIIFALQLDTTFINSMEKKLRLSYKKCTGDMRIAVPLKVIINWKQTIDSIIQSKEYSGITAQFEKETRISPSKAEPCEIIEWYRMNMHLKTETENEITLQKKKRDKENADSLAMLKDFNSQKTSAADYKNIPFGIARKNLIKKLHYLNMIIASTDKKWIVCSITGDDFLRNIAFHLSENNFYCKYEIESVTCSIDSLDTYLRPHAEHFAASFEDRLHKKPDATYRIGKFEILEGSLSVYKAWILDRHSIFIGYSVFDNRYYVKIIVESN